MVACGELHWAAVVREFQGLLALRRLDLAAGIAVLEAAAAEHRAVGSPGDVGPRADLHRLRPPGASATSPGRCGPSTRPGCVISGTRVATWLRATVGAGHASLALGDTPAAAEAFRLAHDRAVEVGDRRIVGTALVGLAILARGTGDDERCVALLRAAAERGAGRRRPDRRGDRSRDAGRDAGGGGRRRGGRRPAGRGAELVPTRWACGSTSGWPTTPDRSGATLAERLGEDRMADLAAEGRAIGLAALVRRASDQLLDGGVGGEPGPGLRLVDGGADDPRAGPRRAG